MNEIKIGIVGYGKIARDQHVPAIDADPEFQLMAITRSEHTAPPGVPVFDSLEQMIGGSHGLEAVSLCTPPQGRHLLARLAIDHGLHVLMEKPPGLTVGEVEELRSAAASRSVALFGTWHSREAPAVDAARRWLAMTVVRDLRIIWKEDVRRWHPGQQWIWEAGGFGVFDPGINALSIATHLTSRQMRTTWARLEIPENRAMPIAANLSLTDGSAARIRADFDWRQVGPQSWDIIATTDRGVLRLTHGGAELSVDGISVVVPPGAEYPSLYRRFAALVRSRGIDVDVAPLRLVEEAFECGERVSVGPFDD